MATETKSPTLTSSSPRSFLNSSVEIALSDLSPALTITTFGSTRDHLGGDHFADAHLLARQALLEEGGEAVPVAGAVVGLSQH